MGNEIIYFIHKKCKYSLANEEEQFEEAQAPRGGRDFGDIGSILAIAGTTFFAS